MQTFLPYASFKDSARCLDDRRLGKQRVEGLQILKGDFPHHPASKMWQNSLASLVDYIEAIIDEWVVRGHDDNVWQKVMAYCRKNQVTGGPPRWLGGKIHETHQASLLRKDWQHYKQFNWDCNIFLGYHWPENNYAD